MGRQFSFMVIKLEAQELFSDISTGIDKIPS
jgi:hypothetical protein